MPYYGLYLSDMREAHFERSDRLAAFSPRREDLEGLLRREKVEVYEDQDGPRCWIKTFRKHGPLEWYNDVRATPPPVLNFGFFLVMELDSSIDRRIEQIYTLEEYVEEHTRRYKALLGSAYDAGMMEAQAVVEHRALPPGDDGQGEEHEDGNEEEAEAHDHAAHGQGEGHHQVDDGQGQDDA